MTGFKWGSSLIALAFLEFAASPQAALAADGPSQSNANNGTQTSSQDGSDGLGDIIVTAQKRSESINKVGMAITAATGDQLKSLGIVSVGGLTKIEPSFVVTSSAAGTAVYTIRGVGYNDLAIAAAPAVSVYQDDIPYFYSALAKGAAYDLERVEILKGPQGTLFGQNSTGGAINFIAAKPTDHFDAAVEATYARFNAINLNGHVSGPLTATLNARLAFDVDRGGAWQRSTTRDDRLGDKDMSRARLLLDWRPTDRLRLAANLNFFRNRSDTQAAQDIGYTPQASSPVIAAVAGQPLVSADPRAADWYHGTHPKADEQFYQASVRAEYDVSPSVTATYLGTYENYSQNDLNDIFGADAQLSYRQYGHAYVTSQELHLGGKAFDRKLDWVIGVNYGRADVVDNMFINSIDTTAAYAYARLGLAAGPYSASRATGATQTTSKAVFGNLDYALLDNLHIHAGGRYTETDIDFQGCTRTTDQNGSVGATNLEKFIRKGVGIVPVNIGDCATLGPDFRPILFTDSLDEDNVSWRTGIDWTVAPGTLVYGSVSKGYKQGSFPTAAVSSYLQLFPVTQESVLAYEIGFKSRLFSNRLTVNGAFFHYNYNDKQVQARLPDPNHIFGFLSELINIPKSTEDGAELQLQFQPNRALNLYASGTFIHSEIGGHPIGYTAYSTQPIDMHGQPLPNTPKWALRGGGRFAFFEGPSWNAYFGADASYQSKAQAALNADAAIAQGFPSLYLKAYALLDLRAGIESSDKRWLAELFGKNVTNTYYWNTVTKSGDTTVRYAGQPATYGIRVGYKF